MYSFIKVKKYLMECLQSMILTTSVNKLYHPWPKKWCSLDLKSHPFGTIIYWANSRYWIYEFYHTFLSCLNTCSTLRWRNYIQCVASCIISGTQIHNVLKFVLLVYKYSTTLYSIIIGNETQLTELWLEATPKIAE